MSDVAQTLAERGNKYGDFRDHAQISDGIIEAMDASGRLFGFERVLELLRTVSSASAVADAAQTFGQEDDISVISVSRTVVLEPVATSQSGLAMEWVG